MRSNKACCSCRLQKHRYCRLQKHRRAMWKDCFQKKCMYHDIITQDERLLFLQELQGKGNQISAAWPSLTDVRMLAGDAMRDVLFLLSAQHSRFMFLLLLRFKETSIQLVQGNKWFIGFNLGVSCCVDEFSRNCPCGAAVARMLWIGFFIWLPRYPWQFTASQWHFTFSPKCTNL